MCTDQISAMHIPVMLQEVLDGLNPQPGGRYLDGTLGLGGHAKAILEAAQDSQVCGLDRDESALTYARQRLAAFGDRVHFFHLDYARFACALAELGWTEINGALLDLGVSSLQLDDPERGFSFRLDGPVDMRMDKEAGQKSAWHMLNKASFEEIRDCLAFLGEEPQAGKIARKIIETRQKGAINTTGELADIVCRAYPAAWRKSARKHPATRTFQAIRMSVNDELGQLRSFLDAIWSWLAPGARLAIISFHSLEDRMVKQAMRAWAAPVKDEIRGSILKQAQGRIITKKPLTPGNNELSRNIRSSSAKFRIIEKLGSSDDFA